MSEALLAARSVEEATEAMASGARPIAGGTDLVVGARSGKAPLPETIVAIDRIDDLRGLTETDVGIRIGALTTHAEIAAHSTVRDQYTALADACSIVGSQATRAHGTIGGNLMNASPAMETGGPLICHDAQVTLRSAAGSRRIAVSELLVGPGETSARPDELLTAVDVSRPAATSASCYVRLEYRRHMEIAVVGATCFVALDGDEIDDARIAITALAPTVLRVVEAEAELIGSDGGRAAAEAAARIAAQASKPITDVRASSDYRRAMAAVIVRRAIEAAISRARGKPVPVPASLTSFGAM